MGIIRHGLSGTVIGQTWLNMLGRCYNPKKLTYKWYGGRGVKVCAFLRQTPRHLLNIVGNRPKGKWLDRIDNNGNYSCGACPECIAHGWSMNLRWLTPSEQAVNRRKPSGGTSHFKGTSWDNKHQKWVAQIKVGKHNRFLGFFEDESSAAQAYDSAVLDRFGSVATTNKSLGLYVT